MSLLRRPLNLWLRLVEKPALRKGTPDHVRRRFERIARLFFHGPRDVAQTWTRTDPCHALHLTPRGKLSRTRLLYIHGGGFVFGSPDTHRAMIARLARDCGMAAVLPRYRLAPEHPYPAALDDVLGLYRGMAAEGPVIVGGDSAGGALALLVLSEALRLNLPAPKAVFAFSPLTDLTFSGQSMRDNAATDVVLPAERGQEMAGLYLQDAAADDPGVSPLFADFKGAPPVWLCAGTTEILLDDTRRMSMRLREQGVDVTETIETDLPHVWPLFHNTLPEARRTLDELAQWISSRALQAGGS